MPSSSAWAVHPVMNMQARKETIFAPGAAPDMAPPNSALPVAMPATCEAWPLDAMPMLTTLFLPSVCTTNGILSAIAVAGLSVPK